MTEVLVEATQLVQVALLIPTLRPIAFVAPHVLLLPRARRRFVHSSAKLGDNFFALLQLQQHVPLLLFSLSPQRCMSVAKA